MFSPLLRQTLQSPMTNENFEVWLAGAGTITGPVVPASVPSWNPFEGLSSQPQG